MRYVAYIDTLGFKNLINKGSHSDAVAVIKLFNQTIYNLWREQNLDGDNSIKGRTFSDSIIIHTENDSNEQLSKLLTFILKLYKKSIILCDLPLRGGLAFGEYDDIKAVEFDNLAKGLVVGTAFVESYLLESSNNIKGSKLLLGQEVKLKIESLNNNSYKLSKVKTTTDGRNIYELIWGNLEFLVENNYSALKKFIKLATSSKWIDHYYGTLETFLVNESSDDKNEIYTRIIEELRGNYKYSDLDNFIENYLKSDNATHTKKSFLAFIRDKI